MRVVFLIEVDEMTDEARLIFATTFAEALGPVEECRQTLAQAHCKTAADLAEHERTGPRVVILDDNGDHRPPRRWLIH
jgi:hypothetical protein